MGFSPLDYSNCNQKKCVCAPSTIPGPLNRVVFDCDNPCDAGEVFNEFCCKCHSPCPIGEVYFCPRPDQGFTEGCYTFGFDPFNPPDP